MTQITFQWGTFFLVSLLLKNKAFPQYEAVFK